MNFKMNGKTELNINNQCACTISLFHRNMVEIGLHPVLQNLATTIAASLTNTALFGNYDVEFLFVLGNPLGMFYNSFLHTTYNMLLQNAIQIAIETKEEETQGIVIRESFSQLLKPVTCNKPYMYDRFITGTMNQVSQNTYGIRFHPVNSDENNQISFSCISCNQDGGKDRIIDDGSFLVILQRGQPIPITGLTIKFLVGFRPTGAVIGAGKIFIVF